MQGNERKEQVNKMEANGFGFGFHNLFPKQRNYIRKMANSKTETIRLPRS